MFCSYCGQEVASGAVICVHCGRPIAQQKAAPTNIDAGAKYVRDVARTFLVIGILNFLVGILVTAVGWPPGILSVLLGIWELVYANMFWSTPPKVTWNPSWITIWEMVNLFCGPFWSLFAGISNRRRLNSVEVKEFFSALQSGQVIPAITGLSPAVVTTSLNLVPTNSKKCPQCAETIALDALACRFCGHQFTEAEMAAARQVARDQAERNAQQAEHSAKEAIQKSRNRLGWVSSIGGGIVTFTSLLLFVAFIASGSSGNAGNATVSGAAPVTLATYLLCPLPLLLVGGALLYFGIKRVRSTPLTPAA